MKAKEKKGKGTEMPKKLTGKGGHCAICGPNKGKNHTTEERYFNARAHAKGDSKGGKKGPRNTNTVGAVDSACEDTSVPSALATLQQQVDELKQLAASHAANPRTTASNKKKSSRNSCN